MLDLQIIIPRKVRQTRKDKHHMILLIYGLLKWLSGKEATCQTGDKSSISGPEDPLEKEIGTISRILGWEIPGTEEPGRL